MTALTAGKLTPRREGDYIEDGVAAATTIYAGAMVMRDASGDLIEGQTATGLVGVGVAEKLADNGSGSAGDINARIRRGTFRFVNSAASDEITAAEIGALCYCVDDQTVAKTDGDGTRSPAGVVSEVDSNGVWVLMDETLTAALHSAKLTTGSVAVAGATLAIPVTHRYVAKTTGGVEALTLADGVPGQDLTISLVSDGGDGTLTPTTCSGFATIVFADAGDTASLHFVDGTVGWILTGAHGATAQPAVTL